MRRNGMKKLIVTTGIIAAMACSLCACGKKEESTTAATTTEATTTEATTAATEATEATTEVEGQGDIVDDSAAVSPEEYEEVTGKDYYSGAYVESVAQRGFIYISKESDGNYLVEVTWPDSAYKSNYWAMHGKFDSNGVLKYDDCVKTVTVFDEDGNETEENGVQSPYIDYEGGKGTITVKNGTLNWVDEEEHIGDGADFIRDFNNSTGTIGR
ncbi:MAG: hypothetical protein IJT72_10360 [Lachnospiraceae bacterium]|nr:hypothetical protein [Lachnospiraceae bacterium]